MSSRSYPTYNGGLSANARKPRPQKNRKQSHEPDIVTPFGKTRWRDGNLIVSDAPLLRQSQYYRGMARIWG